MNFSKGINADVLRFLIKIMVVYAINRSILKSKLKSDV